MCDFFDNFDGEFMNDGFDDDEFDDGVEDYEIGDPVDDEPVSDPLSDKDLMQGDDQSDGFDVEDAFFAGSLVGFAYEEGRRDRRKRRNKAMDKPEEID